MVSEMEMSSLNSQMTCFDMIYGMTGEHKKTDSQTESQTERET